MTEVHLLDTLSREVLPLRPADGSTLGMYCCGPTVYGPAHIGNFRTFILHDVLYRTLLASGYRVNYVRNLTDVDDKTIRGSQAQGESLTDFTTRWTRKFHADCARLNLLPPAVEPTATGHIPEQIALTQTLLDKGFAYVGGDGSVYYKVRCFHGYGKLSHFKIEDLSTQETTSAGKANLADEYEREQAADFALWKAWKAEDGAVAWDSPWGRGRPGWHLECSAMSMKYLGATFDLHGGGEDLCFPHHENEIAQSEAATGQPFVRHWMHCVHLLVEGRKMSKSLGNFFTLEDLVAKGADPMVVRYALLSGHYRSQLNFTLTGLTSAESALKKLKALAEQLAERARSAGMSLPTTAGDWFRQAPQDGEPDGVFARALACLRDDLNTPAALGALFEARELALTADRTADQLRADLQGLRRLLFALGLDLFREAPKAEAPAEVVALARQRWDAKAAKNWAEADRLRGAVTAAGWKILDRKDGFDLEKA